MNFYGRTCILANYTEQAILDASKDLSKLDTIISQIITNSNPIHEQNKKEMEYLKAYYYGDQDIKLKEKYTRPEINNKIVENWAFSSVDFKKTYLLGRPIQYVRLNDSSEEEIANLNRYVRYENKKAKDMEIYEDVLVCGRGYRYVNKDHKTPPDEAPFEIINCDVLNTEVVYSSNMGHEQLFEIVYTPMTKDVTKTNDEGFEVTVPMPYNIYTVYLRNMVLEYTDESGKVIRNTKVKPRPLILKEHLITEYYVNRKRISLIELVKDLLDEINNLESLDADDLEQYVNAIMVFINAQLSDGDLDEIKSQGAVCINSDENKKASVDLLQGTLNSNNTQINYNRLINALHQIIGVPVASDYGVASNGDTGKAKLTGQGYTSAGIRAEGDETMFGRCDFNSLKTIIAVCRITDNSGIKTLKVSDIDSKFQRDMSDNLLIKTQGLMNLYSCDIPREYANAMVNLFPDSHAVSQEQQKLFGDQVSQLDGKLNNNGNSEKTSDVDKANEQENTIKNIEQIATQEQ